jgi:quinoprotein glucose dehydrogenase
MNRILTAMAVFLMCTSAQADTNVEWPAYGSAPGGGHFSEAREISKANVGNLELVWTHRSGDFRAGTQNLTEEITGDTRPGY